MSTTHQDRYHGRLAFALAAAVAIVYIWFGALKLAAASPVQDLVAETVGGPVWFVPALGAIEVIMGVFLLAGWFVRTTTGAFLGHILGTFVVFVTAPEKAFDGEVHRLTVVGEFIVKNIIIAAVVAAVASLRLVETRVDRRPTRPSGRSQPSPSRQRSP